MKRKRSPKMLKILIGGSTPYSDNRGNAAIFGGILKFLNEFQDFDFQINTWHTYPESQQRLINSAATTNSSFGKENEQLRVNVIHYKAPKSSFQAFMVYTTKLSISVMTVALLRVLSIVHLRPVIKTEVVDELMSSDAIIELTFGDTFTDTYYSKIMWFYNSLRMTLELLSKKTVYFFPQSIGPFKYFISRAIARTILNNAKMVAVREYYSFQNVVNLGIPQSKIRFVPDMSFWLPITSSADALNILRANGISQLKNKRKLIALILSENILTKRKAPISLQTVAKIIDCLIDELNVNIVFIPHGTSIGPAFDTRKFSILVHSKLRNKDHAIVLKKDYSVEDLWGVIGQCDIAISTLTHPVMSSLRQGIPVIALSYSHKTLGIMELFGMQEYVLTYNDFGDAKLIRTAKQMLANSEAIKKRLTDKRQFIKANMNTFKRTITEMFTQFEESC